MKRAIDMLSNHRYNIYGTAKVLKRLRQQAGIDRFFVFECHKFVPLADTIDNDSIIIPLPASSSTSSYFPLQKEIKSQKSFSPLFGCQTLQHNDSNIAIQWFLHCNTMILIFSVLNFAVNAFYQWANKLSDNIIICFYPNRTDFGFIWMQGLLLLYYIRLIENFAMITRY